MFKVWSNSRKYLGFRQFVVFAAILISGQVQGQTASLQTRAPASYIPDDDVIVKPIDNELSFYQQYIASDKGEEIDRSRNQLKIWNDNQIFADQYGLDSTLTGSPHFVPTPEEKFRYFQDRYMRYLRRRGEAPLVEMQRDLQSGVQQSWLQSNNASNEIDTIDEMDARFEKISNKTKSGKVLPDSLQEKEVSIWKKTKFIFQPRVEQGIVIVGVKSPIANARAWVGVNGEAEFNIQQRYESIGMRVMFNYYAHTGRYFTSIDQHISGNLYARLTSQRNPDAVNTNAGPTVNQRTGTLHAARQKQDNSLMLLYATQF